MLSYLEMKTQLVFGGDFWFRFLRVLKHPRIFRDREPNLLDKKELCISLNVYLCTKSVCSVSWLLFSLFQVLRKSEVELKVVQMMYKCVNNLVPACISCKIGKRSNAHAYNLRNSEDLNLPGCRTAAAQSGFFYRAAKAWNSLSNNTRTARSLRSFKKHAKAELMKKQDTGIHTIVYYYFVSYYQKQ